MPTKPEQTCCCWELTRRGQNEKNKSKFDKPAREVDPDRTGIDIQSDKSKKEH